MDILRARKKAKGQPPAKKGDAGGSTLPVQEERPPMQAPGDVSGSAKAARPPAGREVAAPLPAAPPPSAAIGSSAVPERPRASGSAEDVAGLAKAMLAQEGEPASAPLAQDLDEAIQEIEAEQAGRRKGGDNETDILQRSVADFVAGFDAQGAGDEEAAYRHSFARQSQSAEESTRYLSFRVAAEEYAIDLTQVRETIKVPAITEVPLTPPSVAGLISLRGTILPVIDLRKRLGLPAEATARKSRVLVAESEGRLVGLLVDEVRDVVEIRKDLIEPPPSVLSPAEAEFVLGVGRTSPAPGGKERVLILLNLVNAARVERKAAA